MTQFPHLSSESPIKSLFPTEVYPSNAKPPSRFPPDHLPQPSILEFQREKNYDLAFKLEMLSEDLLKSQQSNHTLRTYIIELESQIHLLKSNILTYQQNNKRERLEVQELVRQLERLKENEDVEKRVWVVEGEEYKKKIVGLEFNLTTYKRRVEELEEEKMGMRVEMRMQEDAIEGNEKEIIANGVMIERLREEVKEIRKLGALRRVKSSQWGEVGTVRKRGSEGKGSEEIGKIVQKNRERNCTERDVKVFNELIQRMKRIGVGSKELEKIERIEKEMSYIK